MTRQLVLVGFCFVVGVVGCSSEAPPDSEPQTVDPARSTVKVDRSSGVLADGTDTVQVTVTALDAGGRPVAGESVLLSVSGEAVVEPVSTVTDEAGVWRATLTSTGVETVRLIGRLGRVKLDQSPTVQFIAGPAKALAFIVFPGAAEAGKTIEPAVQVAVNDAFGNQVAVDTTVTLTLEREGTAATLLGELSVETVAGVATFSDLKVESAGVGYTLVANAPELEKAKGLPFDVAGAVPATIAFSTQPQNGEAGATFDSIEVEFSDASGNRSLVSGLEVTLALGGLKGAATLGGMVTATAVEGVATFSELFVEKAGIDYTLVASAEGFAGAESDAFEIRAAAVDKTRSALVVTGSGAVADGSEGIAVTLHVEDAFGNALSDSAVTLSSSVANDVFEDATGQTGASGDFTTALTTTKSGARTLFADGAGTSLTAEASFKAGEPTQDKSSVSVDTLEPVANGVSVATITVVLRDRYENPTEGEWASLYSTGRENTLSALAESLEEPGVYTATIASTRAELKTLTVDTDYFSLTQELTFVAGAPAEGLSLVVASPTSAVADGADEIVVEVTLVDASENPVEGVEVELVVTGSDNVVVQPAKTDAEGKTSGTVSSTFAEVKTIRITAGGVALLQEPEVMFALPLSIGGTVSGLVGTGLVLENNGGEPLSISEDGAFEFTRKVVPGAAYNVRASVRAEGQTCTTIGGIGIVGLGNVNDIKVRCGEGWKEVVTGAGASHSMGIRTDGTLWGWGSNKFGQLGDGSNEDRVSRVLIGTDFASVSVGAQHTVALKTDGTAWAWGNNKYGQLGIGSKIDQNLPVEVITDELFVAVSAGSEHTLALKEDGTVWAWGNGTDGRLGNGAWVQKSLPVQVVGTGFSSVAAGEKHNVALKADGTVWTWGYNWNGQLGHGGTAQTSSPQKVGTDTDYISVAAGADHSMALKSNGELWAWGSGGWGKIGDALFSDQKNPSLVLQEGFVSMAGGKDHSIAIKADGTLWGWGLNMQGQVGDGSSSNYQTFPALASETGFVSISAGAKHSLALKADGTLWAWGDNSFGQLGDGSKNQRRVSTQVEPGFSSLALGARHTAAINTDGKLWAWGDNTSGQLGDGSTTQKEVPVEVGTDFVAVAAGRGHTMGIKADATLWAWGDNSFGQLGDGSQTQQQSPVQVSAGVVSVVVGDNHTLALKRDGTLWAWGSNANGQLGSDEAGASEALPVEVGDDFVSIQAGASYSMAFKADGTLWAWGQNASGQLGDDSVELRSLPVEISGAFVSVAAGNAHTMGLASDGTLWGWGENGNGQLGDDSGVSMHLLPVPVESGVASVAAGNAHTLALMTDETLWGWGDNSDGQVGDGSALPLQSAPVLIEAGFGKVAAGGVHSMAIKNDGSLWSWGGNERGQLGDATVEAKSAPVRIQPVAAAAE